MNGYSIKITNISGQTVFASIINQQQSFIDLRQWTGNGLYFVYLIDSVGNIADTKKIILQ
jgi:hypothetical protein